MNAIGVFKKCWNILTTVLLVLAAALLLLFGAPRLFGIQPYVVTSGSMEPEYPVGSLIYVSSVDPEKVAVGDVITFIMPGSSSSATHQVRKIDSENRLFYTQGINNLDESGNIIPDAEPVPFDSLIGRPVLCVPVLGRVNRFCTTPPGMYILLGALAAVIGVSLLLDKLSPAQKHSE